MFFSFTDCMYVQFYIALFTFLCMFNFMEVMFRCRVMAVKVYSRDIRRWTQINILTTVFIRPFVQIVYDLHLLILRTNSIQKVAKLVENHKKCTYVYMSLTGSAYIHLSNGEKLSNLSFAWLIL